MTKSNKGKSLENAPSKKRGKRSGKGRGNNSPRNTTVTINTSLKR